MTLQYFRALITDEARQGEPGEPITFLASTPGEKRDGLDLDQNLWDLQNYRGNPVVLWSHNYSSPPLGVSTQVGVEGGNLVANVIFDQEDEFARIIESKYRRGFLNAVSVGWNPTRTEDGLERNELLEISAVPVPADPNALALRQIEGFKTLKRELDDALKGVISDDNEETEGKTEDAEEDAVDDAVSEDTEDNEGNTRTETEPDDESDDEDREKELIALSPDVRSAISFEIETLSDEIVSAVVDGFQNARAGAILSARNRNDLRGAADLINGVLSRAEPAEEIDDDEDEEIEMAEAASPATRTEDDEQSPSIEAEAEAAAEQAFLSFEALDRAFGEQDEDEDQQGTDDLELLRGLLADE